MKRAILVIALFLILIAGITIAQPLAKAPGFKKNLIRGRTLQSNSGVQQDQNKTVQGSVPMRHKVLSRFRQSKLKQFEGLKQQALAKFRKMRLPRLEKLRELKKEILQKVSELPEKQLDKISKLEAKRIEKIVKSGIVKHAKQLSERELWRLSELSKEQLDKLKDLNEKRLEKIAELPKPWLKKALALPKSIVKNREFDRDDIEKLLRIPKPKLKKLEGLPAARIKEILKKIPSIPKIKMRYLVAKERYLIARENYIDAKKRFMDAKKRMLILRKQYRKASPEDKNKLKGELLNYAVDTLTNQIQAMINRLNALKDTNSAPANVDATIADLNKMLETLDQNNVSKEDIVAIAKQLRGLWLKKHVQAQVVVIKNMVAKLDRLTGKMAEKLDKASALIDKLEKDGLSKEKVTKLREVLKRFQKDLNWLSQKIEEGKQTYLDINQQPSPQAINRIAVKANTLARIAHRKLVRDYAFIMHLGHLYRALQNKETINEEAPEPAKVTDKELQEIAPEVVK